MHFFLRNNIDVINQILNLNEKSTYKLDFGIDFFIQILHPFRSAAVYFSKDTCCLRDIYPIIFEVIKQYEEL